MIIPPMRASVPFLRSWRAARSRACGSGAVARRAARAGGWTCRSRAPPSRTSSFSVVGPLRGRRAGRGRRRAVAGRRRRRRRTRRRGCSGRAGGPACARRPPGRLRHAPRTGAAPAARQSNAPALISFSIAAFGTMPAVDALAEVEQILERPALRARRGRSPRPPRGRAP